MGSTSSKRTTRLSIRQRIVVALLAVVFSAIGLLIAREGGLRDMLELVILGWLILVVTVLVATVLLDVFIPI